jgi:predicted nucleic acid-binding protein
VKILTHLLDTSVYSQRLRPAPHPEVINRWSRLGDQRLSISAICEAELLYGLEKRDSPRLWQEYRVALENKLTLLPIDLAVAQRFAELKAYQERKGKPRADFDLLIAATALRHNLILATGNINHFTGLPGLQVENWFEPSGI